MCIWIVCFNMFNWKQCNIRFNFHKFTLFQIRTYLWNKRTYWCWHFSCGHKWIHITNLHFIIFWAFKRPMPVIALAECVLERKPNVFMRWRFCRWKANAHQICFFMNPLHPHSRKKRGCIQKCFAYTLVVLVHAAAPNHSMTVAAWCGM